LDLSEVLRREKPKSLRKHSDVLNYGTRFECSNCSDASEEQARISQNRAQAILTDNVVSLDGCRHMSFLFGNFSIEVAAGEVLAPLIETRQMANVKKSIVH
jgi:hypothetical protein